MRKEPEKKAQARQAPAQSERLARLRAGGRRGAGGGTALLLLPPPGRHRNTCQGTTPKRAACPMPGGARRGRPTGALSSHRAHTLPKGWRSQPPSPSAQQGAGLSPSLPLPLCWVCRCSQTFSHTECRSGATHASGGPRANEGRLPGDGLHRPQGKEQSGRTAAGPVSGTARRPFSGRNCSCGPGAPDATAAQMQQQTRRSHLAQRRRI